VLRHLQTHQARALAYILENVPLLGDTRSHVMASVHKVLLGCLHWIELVAKGGVKTGI
jgi:hypothetical protein